MAGKQPDWRRLLEDAVTHAGTKSAVATSLGFTRGYVSQVLNGLKDPVPQSFIDRVIERLYVVAECPATGQPQPRFDCRRIACGPAPTHNPLAMRIWACCQRCAEKPEGTS